MRVRQQREGEGGERQGEVERRDRKNWGNEGARSSFPPLTLMQARARREEAQAEESRSALPGSAATSTGHGKNRKSERAGINTSRGPSST